MIKTPIYGLNQPQGNDVVDIEVLNQNLKKIDDVLNLKIDSAKKNDSVILDSSDSVATSKAVKAAYDKGVEALEKASGNESSLADKAIQKRLTAMQLQDTRLRSGFYTNNGDGLLNANGTLFIGGWWHVQVSYHHDANGYGMQIATNLDNDGISRYYRSASGTSWFGWRKILDQRDYDALNNAKTNKSDFDAFKNEVVKFKISNTLNNNDGMPNGTILFYTGA